jgi:hypothetical protein
MGRRHKVNKFRSARKFRHQVGRTHRKNVGVTPMRGGWRL